MSASKQTVAVSVSDRLRAVARKMGGDPNASIQMVHSRYIYERLMARVQGTAFADRWVLKGGVLMLALGSGLHRMTMDADFSVRAGNRLSVTDCLLRICAAPAEPEDGLTYELVTGGRDAPRLIREEARQPTVRARMAATLHCPRPNERRFTVDVTEAELPYAPVMREWQPTLRDFPPLVIPAYPWELVLAEKVHAILTGTLANPRLRDYMDVIALHRSGALDPGASAEWIARVFGTRGPSGPRTSDVPGLSAEFAARRQSDWEGTLGRTGYAGKMPASLDDAISEVRAIAEPLLAACQPADAPCPRPR